MWKFAEQKQELLVVLILEEKQPTNVRKVRNLQSPCLVQSAAGKKLSWVSGQTGQIATVLVISKGHEHGGEGFRKKLASRESLTTTTFCTQRMSAAAQDLYLESGLGASALYSLAEIQTMSAKAFNTGESYKNFHSKNHIQNNKLCRFRARKRNFVVQLHWSK